MMIPLGFLYGKFFPDSPADTANEHQTVEIEMLNKEKSESET